MAALAKVLALCLGTAGGAAACVATGVVPVPGVGSDQPQRPALERPSSTRLIDATATGEADPAYEAAPVEADPPPSKAPTPKSSSTQTAEPAAEPAPAPSGAIEYMPPPPPAATTPAPTSPAASSGSAAGEFGP